MRAFPKARLALAAIALASACALAAQTPLPTRKPLAQVNLKVNETYYLENFKADIDRLESGLSKISGQKVKLASKDKLGILLNTIDMMLFRQFFDREGIKVSDADVAAQITQLKASLGAGATDEALEASLLRNGVFTDTKTYVKQDMLFTSYLKSKKADEMKAIGQPSSADILAAYDDMKFNLRRPASYRFTMLISRTQGKSDAEKKKSLDAMRAVAAAAKADPAAFDGYLVKGALDAKLAGYQTMMNLVIGKTPESKKQYPNLYDAVFKLKEGEVSDLVEEDSGYIVARVSQYLPERQLGFDDLIEGLSGATAAGANPSATVLALVVNEVQTTKYAALQKSTRDDLNAKLRKEGNITISLAALEGILEDPEVAALKALKSQGYSATVQ